MTDNEIIKALECCSKPVIEECCLECPYHLGGQENCHKLLGDIIDLINRKQAEIKEWQRTAVLNANEIIKLQAKNERLKYQVNRLKNYDERRDIALHSMLIANAKSEAIKEFAERLKNSIYINTNLLVYQCEDVESVIDDIVKEMVGEKE